MNLLPKNKNFSSFMVPTAYVSFMGQFNYFQQS